MKELLAELRKESSQLSTKSLSPIGFGYRGRTKIERLLFLISKEYCKAKFAYDLCGLAYGHQKSFFEFAGESSLNPEDVSVVREGFKIAELVWELSSADPYIMEKAIREMGGTVHVLFKNLSDKIMMFISKVEKSCPEN